MIRSVAAALALAVSAGLAGCSGGEPLPPEWRGRDLREAGWMNSTLAPEWTLVLEYSLSSGTDLDWDWFTKLPERQLYFQVVLLEGSRPSKMVSRHASEEDAKVTTPKNGVYQVIWMNDGFLPVDFTWSAREGYSQRLYPPNEGPGCLGLARDVPCLTLPPPTR